MRCRRCGYHLTRLLLTWSCDACAGKVPFPTPQRLKLQREINPVGLRGEEIYDWCLEHPREELMVQDASGGYHLIKYVGTKGFACRAYGGAYTSHWKYERKDFARWECVKCVKSST
jgi:hypothetical protein